MPGNLLKRNVNIRNPHKKSNIIKHVALTERQRHSHSEERAPENLA